MYTYICATRNGPKNRRNNISSFPLGNICFCVSFLAGRRTDGDLVAQQVPGRCVELHRWLYKRGQRTFFERDSVWPASIWPGRFWFLSPHFQIQPKEKRSQTDGRRRPCHCVTLSAASMSYLLVEKRARGGDRDFSIVLMKRSGIRPQMKRIKWRKRTEEKSGQSGRVSH
jgi:hypothetical protein